MEEWKDADSPRETRTVERLKVMASEVERLETIVQTFLRFTERHELNLELSSLNDLLADLEKFITPEARQKSVATRLGLDAQLGPFLFDHALIHQVLLNLMLNAVHAMEGQGGGELILRSRLGERDGRSWAVCDVVDTGTGIRPRVRDKIFDLYFSTREGGYGLGLATSKRITEEHGGVIEVETEEGKGSQFSVFLPYRQSVQADSATAATTEEQGKR